MKKSWGIHLFFSQVAPGLYQAYYFLERPFGNLCLFTPPENLFSLNEESLRQLEFMENKGGVAYQIPLSLQKPNFGQKKLYSRFGAPYLSSKRNDLIDSWANEDLNFRFAFYGEDYFDHRVSFISLYEEMGLFLQRDEDYFLFLPGPYLLDRGQVRKGLGGESLKELPIRGLNFIPKSKNTILIFQFYRGINWCVGTDMVSFT